MLPWMSLNRISNVSAFKRVALVASAQLQMTRAPAALAFMAGVCQDLDIEHRIWDLNAELYARLGTGVWEQISPYTYNNLNDVPDDLDAVIETFLNDIVSEIDQWGADCAAISSFSYVQNQWAERFLRLCRARRSSMTTIIGGPGVGSPYHVQDTDATFGQWLVQHRIVDHYVLGEGDQIFPRFMQGHRHMPGLNSQHVSETWQPQIDDLDAQIRSSYQQVNFDHYQGPKHKPVITLNGSRGCVRRCTFCDVGAIWRRFRYRSGISLADEIHQHWLTTGVTEYWFSDSLINGSLKQFQEMLQTLQQHQDREPGMCDINYSGQFIIRSRSSHPERMYELMAKTGCTHLAVGIESGSEPVRDHMGKKFSDADIDYHLEMSERYGITNYMLTIVGYPTETESDFQATLDMYTRYQRYAINHTILGINLKYTMTILPNTPIQAQQHDLGVEWLHGQGYNLEWRCSTNPQLTVRERYQRWIRLLRHAMALGYNLSEEVMIDVAMNHRKAMSVADQTDESLLKPQIPIILIQSAPTELLS